MRKSHRLLLSLTLSFYAIAATGCCVRKGVTLRGVWSLELNRVPWLQYDDCGDSCGPEAGPALGAPGCTDCATTEYDSNGLALVSGANASGPDRETSLGRFHPVPTRPVFSARPQFIASERPTEPQPLQQLPIELLEELPAPNAQSTFADDTTFIGQTTYRRIADETSSSHKQTNPWLFQRNR